MDLLLEYLGMKGPSRGDGKWLLLTVLCLALMVVVLSVGCGYKYRRDKVEQEVASWFTNRSTREPFYRDLPYGLYFSVPGKVASDPRLATVYLPDDTGSGVPTPADRCARDLAVETRAARNVVYYCSPIREP